MPNHLLEMIMVLKRKLKILEMGDFRPNNNNSLSLFLTYNISLG